MSSNDSVSRKKKIAQKVFQGNSIAYIKILI